MLAWPDRVQVDRAVREWTAGQSARRPELRRLGYFGSYARGDWGPGSDLDLIALVATSAEPFERRALDWDLTPLPVPSDLLVYTEAEWRGMTERGARFAQTVEREAVWVLQAAEEGHRM